MRVAHIEARYTGDISIPEADMPKVIGLFTTVQFIGQIDSMKKQLEERGHEVRLFKGRHAKYEGQILGCSIEEFPGVDAFLYVGDGEFHPIALSLKNSKPVFVYNPFSRSFSRLDESRAKQYKKTRETALKKFYMSEKVGILVSTKPGQNQLNRALELKRKLDKEAYILLSDNIDFEGLENFPFIECFVNTACPRISLDDQKRAPRPIVSIDDITYDMEARE